MPVGIPHAQTGVLTDREETYSKPWFNHHSKVAKTIENAGAVTQIATADATDLPSAIALANANKAKINELIAKLGA